MKAYWNERYSGEEYIYGKEPNLFFRSVLDTLSPGRILLPSEGEGRNAVYAAMRQWEVTAFDSSPVARQKALNLAGENGVGIHYQVCNYPDFHCPEDSFDVISLIYAHVPEERKHAYYQHLFPYLKVGGKMIFEAFSKDQQKYQSEDPRAGGPRDSGMLFSKEEMKDIFTGFSFLHLEEKEITLSEGAGHTGHASVIRFVAEKM